MASFSNSDDEEFTFDLLNNQNNNFENRLILENQTQTTSRAFNYYDATIKTVCYFFILAKSVSNILDFSKCLLSSL